MPRQICPLSRWPAGCCYSKISAEGVEALPPSQSEQRMPERSLRKTQKALQTEEARSRRKLRADICFAMQILTPHQQARMQAASYPWPTHSLAICNVVAEESGHIGPGGQQRGQADFIALLTLLPNRSPFSDSHASGMRMKLACG